MTSPSVLHISTSFPLHVQHPSGWFVWEQVRALAAQGWGVSVLAPHADGAKEQEIIDDVLIHRYRYADPRREKIAYGGGIPANLRADKSRWLLVPSFFGSGFSRAKKLAPDANLVHAHWSFAGLMAYGVTRRLDMPFLVSFHGSDVMGASGSMLKVARFVARRAARIVVHSRAMADAVATFADKDKIVRLPHGVDPERFAPANPKKGEPPRIIAVGRLSDEKGFDLLIDALSQISNSPWTCTIVGDGPQHADLERRAKAGGIGDRILLPGAMPHDALVTLLSKSHLFVLPSRREGFGLACLEACAAGLPVVATKSGGPQDIVDDEVTGRLVPIENPDALAGAIAALLADPAKRQRMGGAAREKATADFSHEVVTRRLIEVYQDVLGA